MNIELYLTPLPFAEANLENKTVVVVDVLRFSTSACAALMAGAKGVIPTAESGEAAELRAKLGRNITVLAGERNGVRIDNFDLGNSPAEFTKETVGGKFVVMTTTNGTAMFKKTAKAWQVLAGGLVNVSKIVEKITENGKDLVIACSGRQGNFSIEDTLCGGLMIERIFSNGASGHKLNDAALMALQLYQNNSGSLYETIEKGEHGRFLVSIGFKDDIGTATAVDSIPVRPVLNDGRLIIDEN
ncbi:MAG: 2-phosphosulfolactate phosphatase [candidate division Zixibacteria bacterium]|nr:2-phosphosulfolactate phosphatase [candidate division Zixibacteria bacterium]